MGAPYKHPTIAGTSRSSSLLVTRDLTGSKGMQYVADGDGTGSKDKQITLDLEGHGEIGRGGYPGYLEDVRPWGRFWALEQIEEEDEDN